MKIKFYIAAIVFSCVTVGLQAQSSLSAYFISTAPTGEIYQRYGHGFGMAINYERNSGFGISKNLPVSFISSFDIFEVGRFDNIENAAVPSDVSRKYNVRLYNESIGLSVGGRLSLTAINRVKIYTDVFGSIRYFNSDASFYTTNDVVEEDCPKNNFDQNLYEKVVPQIGFAGGIQYQIKNALSVNFRVAYLTGGPIKLAHTDRVSREENDVITINLDELSKSNFLTFQIGLVASF